MLTKRKLQPITTMLPKKKKCSTRYLVHSSIVITSVEGKKLRSTFYTELSVLTFINTATIPIHGVTLAFTPKSWKIPNG